MPILANVGRRSLRARILIALMYAVLVALGSTMVVPFLITISSSLSNELDYDRFTPLPRFLYSKNDRFVKGLVGYFNEYPQWQSQMKSYFRATPEHWASWREIGRDYSSIDSFASAYLSKDETARIRARIMASDYSEFSERYPITDMLVSVSNLDAATFLEKYYEKKALDAGGPEKGRNVGEDALRLLNSTWGSSQKYFFSIKFDNTENKNPYWQQSFAPPTTPRAMDYELIKELYRHGYFSHGIEEKWSEWLSRSGWKGKESADIVSMCTGKASPELTGLWLEFKARNFPASPAIPFAMRAVWIDFLAGETARKMIGLREDESFDVGTYNRLAGTSYKSIRDIPFPLPQDSTGDIRTLWNFFVENQYPLRLTDIDVTPEREAEYQNFLKGRFKNVEYANKLLGTSFTEWSEFKLEPSLPPKAAESRLGNIWMDFVKSLPANCRKLRSSEKSFQDFLLVKYGSVQAVNGVYGWNISRIEEAFPPLDSAYLVTFENMEWGMTLKPSISNYSFILSYLLKQGRAIFVTILLVTLTVLVTLIVNPMCAYALSRFSIAGKDKVILFMLATMAFPAMISAIPAYLLMRDLGLLNSFFALILPGAASGMAIFMLKGFFDSLPQELYEAATIDGAREWQIFLVITLPMMKPILAINALSAFMAAYNGWEWALIICQDQSMWTISVWMYQANQLWSPYYPWIVSAGFIIVSIPTILIFLFCQKIILEGIIIPQMK